MDCSEGNFESVDTFIVTLEDLISKKASDDALNRIFDGTHENLVKMGSLDILNMVGTRLKDRNSVEGDVDEWHNLQSMLEYVVTVSSPKEMLIGLLSLLEIAQSDEFFLVVVRLLRTTFLRLPSQRGDTLLWALNEIHDYISRVQLPDYLSSLDDKEKLVLENSPELARLETCVTSALDFCESLVSEARECKLIATVERRQGQIMTLASFLLKLIEHPVAHFDFNSDRYDCVQRLVQMLFDLKENFVFAAIEWQEVGRLSLQCRFTEDTQKMSTVVDPVAIGALASFIYAHGICADRLPQVYAYEHIFERLLSYINAMLRKGPNLPFVELGMDLLKIFCNRFQIKGNGITKSSIWEAQRIQDSSYQELFLNLINIMTYSSPDHIRKSALALFTRFLDYFEPNGQMLVIQLVYHIFERQDEDGSQDGMNMEWFFANKGICGYLIDYYRTKLNEELRSSEPKNPYFQNLPRMLALFTRFQHREETDFLENFDQCMAALNLTRFLCMIRVNGRRSLPNHIFSHLSKDFVEPMRKGLELSKAHYELDLKGCKENQRAKSAVPNGAPYSVGGGREGEKMNVLHSAINSFDLMMSLVARVSELLEQCVKAE